jgi:hypothetical protein
MFVNSKLSIAADRMMSRFLRYQPVDVLALYAGARERIFINPAFNEPSGPMRPDATSPDVAGPRSLMGGDHFGKRVAEGPQ